MVDELEPTGSSGYKTRYKFSCTQYARAYREKLPGVAVNDADEIGVLNSSSTADSIEPSPSKRFIRLAWSTTSVRGSRCRTLISSSISVFRY